MKDTIKYIVVLLAMTACKGSMDREQYVKWMADRQHGLHKTTTINHIVFDLQYKTPEYTAIMELKSQPALSAKDIEAYKDLQNFELNLSVDDKNQDILDYGLSDREQVQQRLYAVSFPLQNEIFLVEGKDTLPCVMYHFIRSYDLSKKRTLMLAFEKAEHTQNADKLFLFNSDEFHTGPVKIAFGKKELETASHIKLTL